MNSYKQNGRFLKKQFLLFISLRAKAKGVKIEYKPIRMQCKCEWRDLYIRDLIRPWNYNTNMNNMKENSFIKVY